MVFADHRDALSVTCPDFASPKSGTGHGFPKIRGFQHMQASKERIAAIEKIRPRSLSDNVGLRTSLSVACQDIAKERRQLYLQVAETPFSASSPSSPCTSDMELFSPGTSGGKIRCQSVDCMGIPALRNTKSSAKRRSSSVGKAGGSGHSSDSSLERLAHLEAKVMPQLKIDGATAAGIDQRDKVLAFGEKASNHGKISEMQNLTGPPSPPIPPNEITSGLAQAAEKSLVNVSVPSKATLLAHDCEQRTRREHRCRSCGHCGRASGSSSSTSLLSTSGRQSYQSIDMSQSNSGISMTGTSTLGLKHKIRSGRRRCRSSSDKSGTPPSDTMSMGSIDERRSMYSDSGTGSFGSSQSECSTSPALSDKTPTTASSNSHEGRCRSTGSLDTVSSISNAYSIGFSDWTHSSPIAAFAPKSQSLSKSTDAPVDLSTISISKLATSPKSSSAAKELAGLRLEMESLRDWMVQAQSAQPTPRGACDTPQVQQTPRGGSDTPRVIPMTARRTFEAPTPRTKATFPTPRALPMPKWFENACGCIEKTASMPVPNHHYVNAPGDIDKDGCFSFRPTRDSIASESNSVSAPFATVFEEDALCCPPSGLVEVDLDPLETSHIMFKDSIAETLRGAEEAMNRAMRVKGGLLSTPASPFNVSIAPPLDSDIARTPMSCGALSLQKRQRSESIELNSEGEASNASSDDSFKAWRASLRERMEKTSQSRRPRGQRVIEPWQDAVHYVRPKVTEIRGAPSLEESRARRFQYEIMSSRQN